MDAIDIPSLPSSVYQPNEQDYGLWSDSLFPFSQTEGVIEQQRIDSYMSFPNCMDFSTHDETPLMSDVSGYSASWDGLPMPVAYDVTEAQPGQEQMCQLLRAENAELKKTIENNARRIREVEAQFDAIQEWTAKVSSVLNDVQLKQQGLSPVQKQFGRIIGPLATKKKRTRTQENKREVDRVKGKGDTERRIVTM